MQLTIFTPTFNRAYRLPALYESLKKQTVQDFEWLVVDDGSQDETSALFEQWIKETAFSVRYISQNNGGKHRAINYGVKEAHGKLFFIVDSDDWLTPDAVEKVLNNYEKVSNQPNFAGICGMKAYSNEERVGGNKSFETYACSLFDFRYKYNIYGDLAEVYLTEILARYPFPDVDGEVFCPEALVWHKIAKKYKLLFFNENIYICEYLPDGLTVNSLLHRIKSPVYSMLTYEEVWHSPIPLKKRCKGAISFWRFHFHCPSEKRYTGKVSRFFMLPGFIAYWRDCQTLRKSRK